MNNALKRFLLAAGALVLAPSPAHAHTPDVTVNGWQEGFSHPLHGMDHLLVMIVVGVWAA